MIRGHQLRAGGDQYRRRFTARPGQAYRPLAVGDQFQVVEFEYRPSRLDTHPLYGSRSQVQEGHIAAAEVRQPALQIAERLGGSRVLGLAVRGDGLGTDLCLGRRAGRGGRYEALLVDGFGLAVVDVVAVTGGEAQNPHDHNQADQHSDEARRRPP